MSILLSSSLQVSVASTGYMAKIFFSNKQDTINSLGASHLETFT